MKKVFLSALLAVGCLFAASAQENAGSEGAPEIKFKETTHDFGVIEHKGNGTYEFKFTNVGTAPLLISGALASCGCTTPSYTKEPIEPGKSGVITVKYDTNRVGVFNKSVTVNSNAKQEVLYIKGEVKEAKSAGGQQ